VRKDHVVWFLVGVLAYYGFLRFTGKVSGMPWAPMTVASAA
jgi:hypothetical protein